MGKEERTFKAKSSWSKIGSVKWRLLITFLIILLVPSILIGTFSYQKAAKQVQQQMLDKATTSVSLLDDVINQFILAKQQEVDTLAQTLNGSMVEVEQGSNVGVSLEASKTLDTYKGSHPEVSLAYIGTEDGVYINSPSTQLNPPEFDPRVRPWYIAAMENKGEVIVTSPYVSNATNTLVITVAKTTSDGIGVVAANVDLEQIEQIAQTITIGNNGYAYIIDAEKNYLYHPEEEAGSQAAENEALTKLFAETEGYFEDKQEDSNREIIFVTNSLTGWKLAGTFETTEFTEAASPILNTMLNVLILAIIIGIALTYLVLRSIIKPLNALLKATKKISEGDLTEHISYKSKDEFGELSNSFNQMIDSIRSILSSTIETSNQVAASSEELNASSEQTSKATEQVSIHAQEMAEGAEKQVNQLNESLETSTDLAQRSQTIVTSVSALKDTASVATNHSELGGQTVQSAVSQMNSIQKNVTSLSSNIQNLGDRSAEIGNIVSVIKDISGQTNLLALNAAIEAARAGEQGRGFAVVADEVRKLAVQSEEATKQIEGLISTIQNEVSKVVSSVQIAATDTEDGIRIIHQTGERFEDIRQAIVHISEQIDTVSEQSEYITKESGMMVEALQEVSSVSVEASSSTQNVAAAAQQTLASMEEIASSAGALAGMAEELQTLVGQFKLYK